MICYTKPYHRFRLLMLLVAASHSCHDDSLVRGIVICCTKFGGTPHGGVVCPPCREGSCWVLRRLIQVCLTRGLVAVCTPPHPSPSSPSLRRLDLLPHSCPLDRESPPGTNSLGWKRIASEFRNAMGCSHSNVFVSSPLPKKLAAPTCFWNSAIQCIR